MLRIDCRSGGNQTQPLGSRERLQAGPQISRSQDLISAALLLKLAAQLIRAG